jgi:hypothetical protein
MHLGLRIGAMAFACLLLTAANSDHITIDELIAEVRAGIHQNKSDKDIAKSVRKLQLSQKMEERVIEELQSEGAGPDTLEELLYKRDASDKLPLPDNPPHFDSPPRPSIDEQKSFFHQVATNAFQYVRRLPDFICTQQVHRYTMGPATVPGLLPSMARSGSRNQPVQMQTRWWSKDMLTVKLTYFENHEKYELVSVNGKKANTSFEAVGGAISEGEFGSTLMEVFDPATKSQFRWDHWTHLRKRLTRVYSFTGTKDKSHYRVGTSDPNTEQRTIIVGRHGFVYADDETRMVVRILVEADSIPKGYPVIAATSLLDYDFSKVGDHRYLLPLRAEARMKTTRIQYRNVVDFTDYRKFSGESSISFDAPDAGPDPAKAPEPTPPVPPKP